MEDDQNGVVVVGRPPNSDTCGMIVNHGGGDDRPTTAAAAAAAPPTPALPAAAATAFGAPARPAPRYGAHYNCNNNISVIKGQQLKVYCYTRLYNHYRHFPALYPALGFPVFVTRPRDKSRRVQTTESKSYFFFFCGSYLRGLKRSTVFTF